MRFEVCKETRKEAMEMLAYVKHLDEHVPTRLLGSASAFDTDEKWIEVTVYDNKGKRLVVDGKIQKVRLYVDYDIRNRFGNTLYSVRQ